MSHCGKSETDVIMRVTFHPCKVPTYHLLLAFSPASRNTGPKEVLFGIAHHVIILVLVTFIRRLMHSIIQDVDVEIYVI